MFRLSQLQNAKPDKTDKSLHEIPPFFVAKLNDIDLRTDDSYFFHITLNLSVTVAL